MTVNGINILELVGYVALFAPISAGPMVWLMGTDEPETEEEASFRNWLLFLAWLWLIFCLVVLFSIGLEG